MICGRVQFQKKTLDTVFIAVKKLIWTDFATIVGLAPL